MKRLVSEPSLRSELRAAARERAARFSWQRGASALLDIYRAVASSAALRGRPLQNSV